MTHKTQPAHPDPDAVDSAQHHPPVAAWRRLLRGAWHLLCKWSESIGPAMERAEKRIMENFRVPPGGG